MRDLSVASEKQRARALELAADFGPLDSLAVGTNDALGMLIGGFKGGVRRML